MLISNKELDSKIPDISGENSNIYFLSEYYLAKRFLDSREPKKSYRLKKYEVAKKY